MPRISVILFLIFQTLLIKSQNNDIWTLDRCIQHALEHNKELKINRNIEEKASLDKQQSKWNLLPSVNGYGRTNFDFSRSTDQFNQVTSGNTFNINYGISSSLDIFAGFSKINRIAAGRYNALATEEHSNLMMNNLISRIIEIYSLALYQKELTDVLEQQLETSRRELKRIEAHLEAGRTERVMLYEMQAVVSMNELELNRAKNQHRLLKLQLAQAIELPAETELTISDADFQLTNPANIYQNVDSIYAEACINYPAIMQKEYELEYYEKMLSISKGRFAPSLYLNAGYNSTFFSTDTMPDGRQTSFQNQFDNYLNPFVSLSLNIPIFNRRQQRTDVQKSSLDVDNALLNLQNQKRIIKQEIEEATVRLSNYYMEYMNAMDNLKHAQKSFEIHQEKYRLGLITTNDFMSAQYQLSQARSGVIHARYSWVVQKKTIDLIAGRF